MEPKDIIRYIRGSHHLTQEQMASQLGVTRQAVSRWETGHTWPNPEMLKTISKHFDISINTLLGSPNTLHCHYCGLPLDEAEIVYSEISSSELATKTALWKWLYDNYSKDFYERIIELIRNADSFDAAVSEMSARYAIDKDVATEFLNLPFIEASLMDKQFCKREWQKYLSFAKMVQKQAVLGGLCIQ